MYSRKLNSNMISSGVDLSCILRCALNRRRPQTAGDNFQQAADRHQLNWTVS